MENLVVTKQKVAVHFKKNRQHRLAISAMHLAEDLQRTSSRIAVSKISERQREHKCAGILTSNARYWCAK